MRCQLSLEIHVSILSRLKIHDYFSFLVVSASPSPGAIRVTYLALQGDALFCGGRGVSGAYELH